MKYYLAIDIGASSGRHIIGWHENGTIQTDEVHRFPNFADNADGNLTWDIDRLFNEVKTGIAKAFAKYPSIESLAIDTWGVDYVLMNGESEILPCHCYRDRRTEKIINEVHATLPFEKFYGKTGIQHQPFNTIYQIYADKKAGRLSAATSFFMLPEYLGYKLCGNMKKEFTNASTTGLVNLESSDYDTEIINALGLPKVLFEGALHMPGTKLGRLKEELVCELGGNTNVMLCASHDTASAFESVDTGFDSLILSSGTWSLLGLKSREHNNSSKALKANFTNECSLGYTRLLKNIAGLWIIGQLRKEFALSFSDTASMAQSSSFASLFDVNDALFLAPQSMAHAIKQFFLSRNMPAPENTADILNSAYHSLAESYRNAIVEIEEITKQQYGRLYVIGGGANDKYLNALTMQYTGKEIIALPIEATSIGNLKVQMQADNSVIIDNNPPKK